MTPEKTVKLDAIDLVMTALKEHEKYLDHTVRQLTLLAKSLEKTKFRFMQEIHSIEQKNESSTLEINIDNNLLHEAQKLGLNISDIFEKALKDIMAQQT